MSNEIDDWHLAKQIAAGILIAAAVLGVAYYLIQVEKARRVNAALADFTETIQAIEAEHRTEQAAARNALEAKARAKAAAEQARLLQTATRTQAEADRARLQQAEAVAKEQAWQQFYGSTSHLESATTRVIGIRKSNAETSTFEQGESLRPAGSAAIFNNPRRD